MRNTNLSNVAQFNPGESTRRIVGLRIESVWPARRNDLQSNDKLKTVLSTLDYLLSDRASMVILSHVEVKIEQPHDFGHRLSELIVRRVRIPEEYRGLDFADAIAGLKRGEPPPMIGNLALELGEAVNDLEFSRFLSGVCDVYSNEAFGLAHQVRASTLVKAILARQLGTGLVFDGTLRSLSSMLDAPEPLVLGEPTQAVADRARCPVLLVRFRKEESGEEGRARDAAPTKVYK